MRVSLRCLAIASMLPLLAGCGAKVSDEDVASLLHELEEEGYQPEEAREWFVDQAKANSLAPEIILGEPSFGPEDHAEFKEEVDEGGYATEEAREVVETMVEERPFESPLPFNAGLVGTAQAPSDEGMPSEGSSVLERVADFFTTSLLGLAVIAVVAFIGRVMYPRGLDN